jgi:adenosylhomocysteine nucleosidase
MESGTGDPVWRSNLPANRIAVIAALELEARILRVALPGQGLHIHVSGPGPARAAATARRAIEAGARALVAWGFAGGLGEGVASGTVHLPSRIVSEDGEWYADPDWRRRLAGALSRRFDLIDAVLYSADRVLTTAEDKVALAARTGARAVDMESAAVAEVAAAAGLPFVALRVIADGPDEALPDNVEALVTEGGRPRYRGLAGVIVSPRRLPLLIRLARRSQGARRILRRVAETLIEGER